MRGHTDRPSSGVRAMTWDPSDHDAPERLPMLRRGCPANTNAVPSMLDLPHIAEIAERLMIPPASTWSQAVDKARFLLECYATTPQGQDPGTRKLIDRALGDMARLQRRAKEKT